LKLAGVFGTGMLFTVMAAFAAFTIPEMFGFLFSISRMELKTFVKVGDQSHIESSNAAAMCSTITARRQRRPAL
jgi:hypothetical protein